MGLDNYASRNSKKIELSEEDVRAFEEAGIDLCGGIASRPVRLHSGARYMMI